MRSWLALTFGNRGSIARIRIVFGLPRSAPERGSNCAIGAAHCTLRPGRGRGDGWLGRRLPVSDRLPWSLMLELARAHAFTQPEAVPSLRVSQAESRGGATLG